MKRLFLILLCFGLLNYSASAQSKKDEKIQDVFFKYITEKLGLNPQETEQIRVLAPGYLAEMRKAHKNITDPLLRDQRKIAIKLRYRERLSQILGAKRATLFFTEEQLFRKKIREELRQRNQD